MDLIDGVPKNRAFGQLLSETGQSTKKIPQKQQQASGSAFAEHMSKNNVAQPITNNNMRVEVVGSSTIAGAANDTKLITLDEYFNQK